MKLYESTHTVRLFSPIATPADSLETFSRIVGEQDLPSHSSGDGTAKHD